MAGRPDADALQGRGEEEVVLVAVPPAGAADQLLLDAGQVQGDRAAEEDVGVGEGRRGGVRPVQGGDRGRLGVQGPVRPRASR